MARSKSNNLHSPGNVSGLSPGATREVQNIYDRLNYLTQELERLRSMMPTMSSGSAKKENPIEGIITIPSVRGDGLIRVSKDGVITSYVNATSSIFPYMDLRTVGNVGTGVDQLHTFLLPAKTLSLNGDYLDIWYGGGVSAGDDDDKRVLATFDGQNFIDTGSVDLDQNVGWMAAARIIRTSSTTVRTSSFELGNLILASSTNTIQTFTAGGNLQGRTVNMTVSNLDTTAISITVFGEGTNNNNIIQSLSIIDFGRPKTLIQF